MPQVGQSTRRMAYRKNTEMPYNGTNSTPENITRLRRFACGVIQFISKGKPSISQKMQQLNRNTRLVFDYLRMTSNSILLTEYEV